MTKKKRAQDGGFHVETWLLDRIKPYPGNPRLISEKAAQKVLTSIKEFGWRQPIVVDRDGVIIAGHTRYAAALAGGMLEAPVHVATSLTEAQVRAYRIADNRVSEETDWDNDKLVLELGELSQIDVDISTLGFDEHDLSDLLGDNAYAPTLDPQKSGGDAVTSGDVDEAGQRMRSEAANAGKQDVVDVICPHCGKEFGLQRRETV